MNKFRKIIGLSLALPLAVLFGLATWFYFMDLNEYKGTIAKALEAATGRKISIEGGIEKSFFPWLGVQLGAIEVSNAKGFEAAVFARAEKVGIKVALLPLFSQRIEVNTVELSGLSVHLARNKDGVNNWDDLTATQRRPKSIRSTDTNARHGDHSSPSNWMAGLVIGGLRIDDAQVGWLDQQTGTDIKLTNIDITSGAVKFNQPIDLEVALDFESTEPDIGGQLFWSGRMYLDIAKHQYQIKNSDLFLVLGREDISVKQLRLSLKSDINANMARQTIKLTNLNLDVLRTKVTGEISGQSIIDDPHYFGELQIAEFNPRDVMQELLVMPPITRDATVFSKANAQFNLQGSMNSLALSNITVNLDETIIKGDFGISNFKKNKFDFKLSIDELNLDRYLSPPVESAVESKQRQTTGKTKKPEPLPLDLLRSLHGNGRLSVEKLVIKKAVLEKVEMRFGAIGGRIRIKPLTAKFYKGDLRSDIRLDVSENIPQLNVQQSLLGIHVQPLFIDMFEKDKLSGVVLIKSHLEGSGSDIDSLTKTLNGRADFQFKNGTIKDFNLAEKIRGAYAKYRKKELPPSRDASQTDFTEIKGSLKVSQGIIQNNDLSAKSPLFRAGGKGLVDLPKQKIDYTVQASIVKSIEGQSGLATSELDNITIPIIIRGPFDQLDIKVDVKSALKAVAKKAVQREKIKVKKKLQQKKQEAKKKLKDKLKERLKKLF